MHIFLTGGTGEIGSAVLACAVQRGHSITALARSETAEAALRAAGAQPKRGDIATPESWIDAALDADVFIHLASSFDEDMAISEARLIDVLAEKTRTRETPCRLLYTGGGWLYGRTGNAVAHEGSPLRPIPAFDWAVRAITRLGTLPGVATTVIHPAMVYHAQGGVFGRMITALRAGRPAVIWGDLKVQWPLVERSDAAAAYVLLAETPAATGPFNIVTETGVPTGEIAAALHAQAGNRTRAAVIPRDWVLRRHGPWAEGPMLDQQMSGAPLRAIGWTPQVTDFASLRYFD